MYLLSKEKKKNAWLVQLATWMKRKVTEIVKYCKLSFNGLETTVNLNVLLLGPYDILVGMDWLVAHKDIIYYLHKIFDYMDERGNTHIVKGI